ncbi:class I SAM-dependent methyltransferase [Streptomyces sp. NPDC059650]|uniref:class I SAM-dependent methyltransferase n=1 Tax=Streptomyces sp. NPDC059650 TaxID=3346896 RepID=UPI0036BAB35C
MPPALPHIRALLTSYLNQHPGEREALAGLLTALDTDRDPTSRSALPGHVTCGAVVIDRHRRVLHIRHKATDRLAARPELADRVRLVDAGLGSLPFDGELFDAVCCHGVLMYLDDPGEAVARLAGLVAQGGLLSILAKNRRAIDAREALVGDSETARRLIVSGAGRSVGNLGRETRGDDLDALDRLAAEHGLSPLPSQGVRIFHDHLDDAWAPEPAAYAAALELEWAASSRSPYRALGHLVHPLARRPERSRS